MTERDKKSLAFEGIPAIQRGGKQKAEGWEQGSATKNSRQRNDLEMQDHLLEAFRSTIENAMVQLRKEELSKAFAKIEEGRSPD